MKPATLKPATLKLEAATGLCLARYSEIATIVLTAPYAPPDRLETMKRTAVILRSANRAVRTAK